MTHACQSPAVGILSHRAENTLMGLKQSSFTFAENMKVKSRNQQAVSERAVIALAAIVAIVRCSETRIPRRGASASATAPGVVRDAGKVRPGSGLSKASILPGQIERALIYFGVNTTNSPRRFCL